MGKDATGENQVGKYPDDVLAGIGAQRASTGLLATTLRVMVESDRRIHVLAALHQFHSRRPIA
jgi:hypothetical protein